MKLSVIIPTYNSAKLLGRALDSIVCQSFPDWEVVVMDGASEDDTVAIAQSYHESRIRVYSEPDKGIYDAMNKGIECSFGEWLLFLGSDDYFCGNKVFGEVRQYLSDEYDVVYGDVESNLSDEYKGEWRLECIDANRCQQAIFYNRRFFGDALRFNLKYPVLADFDINLRWFLNKKYKHRFIPVVISHFSDGGYSSNHEDNAFYEDFGLNKLRYNYRTLTAYEKKRAALQFVNANPDKVLLKTGLLFYAQFMRIIYKANVLFGRISAK